MTPPQTITIYVRMFGNDSGDGSLANPFRTLPRAVREVPSLVPPDVSFHIDVTGMTEVLPVDYVLPAWKAPVTLVADFSTRFWHLSAGVVIEAEPELVPLAPVSDATINPGDVTGISNDPITNLVTITIFPPRTSWTNAALKGKHLIGAAVGFEQSVILEATSTTLLISTDFAPTFPADIMQESAHYSGSQDVLGTISSLNVDSIAFHGIEITSDNDGTSIYSDGNGIIDFEFCTLQNPYLTDISVVQSKLLNSRVFGDFMLFGQNTFSCSFSFFDNCTGATFAATPGLNPVFRNTLFEACDPIEARAFTPFLGERGCPASFLAMSNCLVKDGLGDGVIFHGTAGFLQNVDIQNCQGSGLIVNDGVGLLHLENVQSSVPNGASGAGFGLVVDDGQFVKVDAATYLAATPLTGIDGDMKVGSGAMRTWSNYASGADNRPPLLELDFTAFANVGGTFSDATPAPAYIIGTGSKVYS